MILFEKYGQHQPLNRQSRALRPRGRRSRACRRWPTRSAPAAAVLRPLFELIQAHVLAAERLHGDDTTVPVLAKGKTVTGRCWTYVRDDRPFGGPGAAGGAVLLLARPRGRASPAASRRLWSGILQADAYGGYNKLYAADRSAGPIIEAACWAHARRKFFVLADIAAAPQGAAASAAVISPLALEAVQRIDALFDIEREHQRPAAEQRLPSRQRAQSRRWSPARSLDARASAPSSRATPTSPRPWTTCSSAGPPSPASSTTAASA